MLGSGIMFMLVVSWQLDSFLLSHTWQIKVQRRCLTLLLFQLFLHVGAKVAGS